MLTIRNHYAKEWEKMPYRLMTIDEAKNLKPGNHVWFISVMTGDARRCKVNGAPKTWKTRPNDCKVPLKYGLYEYSYAEWVNGNSVGVTLIVPEEESR